MTQTTKTLTFDCVAYKRQTQAKIYDAIRELTPEGQRLYFQQSAETGTLGEWWRRISKKSPRQATT